MRINPSHVTMQERQFRGQDEEKLVLEICEDDLSEDECLRRVMALLARHKADLERGLRKVDRSNPQWQRARENRGYGTFQSLTLEAAEYLLHVPQKDKYAGMQRICTFLNTSQSFGDWLSTKLYGLARGIQNEIKKEEQDLQRSTDLSEPEGPTLSGSASTFSPSEAIAEDPEMDQTLDYIDERMKNVVDRAAMLLDQLGGDCRGILDGFFLSDAPEIPEVISRVEKCLDQFADILKKEDVEPRDFGIGRGKSDLWRCARELSNLCKSLVLGRFFLGLGYFELGRAYSDNKEEDYESNYKRAEQDWARYRIKEAKCKDEVEEECTQNAAAYMEEA